MLFTLIVQFATNTGIVTISVAYSLCSCIGLLFVTRWLQEIRERISDKQSRFVLANLWKEKKFLQSSFVAFICSVIFFQFAGTFYLRMTYAWGDSPMETLTQAMERGPLKGVYTSPKTANWYGEVLEELDMLHLTQEDQLMVFGVAPWIYLYVDAGCGNYSTWQVHENSTQIYDYYGLHPDKFPNVIYMAHWADIFLECELSNQFKERGYELVYEGTGTVMMSPERAQKYEKGV